MLAGLAFLLGLVIMLSALEVYWNVQFNLEAQKKKGQFLIVNKKISLSNTLGLVSSSFSREEMKTLAKAPTAKRVGFLQANHFQATIKANTLIDFSTFVFFESVPNAFLDEPNPDFRWREGSQVLPIIVSQDFLNLYNFGFALSQKLPQVSREALKMVPFEVIISGPGGEVTFEGQIVGYTERISSVLVPGNFMTWANSKIGQKPGLQPSRAILHVENISDPGLLEFLKANRLSADQEKMRLGKTGTFIRTFLQATTALGLIFMVLAFIMFTMNFRLILAEAAADIRLLLELGYRHTTLSFHLISIFSLYLLVIFGLSHFILVEIQQLIQPFLSQNPGEASSFLPLRSLGTGLSFTLAIIFLNVLLIQRQLYKTY